MKWYKSINHKTGVISDPLSQTRSLASSDNFHLKFVCFEKWDGRTTCVKTTITTSRDGESASWIKIFCHSSK